MKHVHFYEIKQVPKYHLTFIFKGKYIKHLNKPTFKKNKSHLKYNQVTISVETLFSINLI